MRIYPSKTVDGEFQTLGTQGYTGNLNDRQKAALDDIGLGDGGLNDKLRLYNDSAYSNTAYHADDYIPEFIADFVNGNYCHSGATSTFANAFTYASTTNKTMVDSDGLLKWAPHNLFPHSEQFDNAAWTKTNTTVMANAAVAPNGTMTADEFTHTTTSALFGRSVAVSVASGVNHTLGVFIKYVDHQWFRIYGDTSREAWFDLANGVVGTESNVTASMQSVGNGWYYTSIIYETPDANSTPYFLLAAGDGSVLEVAGTSAYLWGAHLYRSDLGGMVNNPDRGDSYVPTTDAAVYQARRNAYYYNGSSWVNGGLQLESEARTNLVTYSNDFSNWNNSWGGGTTLTAAQETGPDGILSMTKIARIDGDGDGCELNGVILAASTTYAFSLYVHGGTADRSRVVIYDNNAGADLASLTFDWSAGVPSTNASSGASNINYKQVGTGGLYRISFTATTAGTVTTHQFNIQPEKTGSGTEYIYAGFVQIEAGSTPSSYIPTSGATATRNAETLTLAAADTFYNASGLSMQMNGLITYADESDANQVALIRWWPDGSNYIYIRLDTNGANVGQIDFFQNESATVDDVQSASDAYSPGVNVAFNIASRHTAGAINGAVGGTALTENSTPTALADLSSTNLEIGYDFMGFISQVLGYDKDIGDTGIAEIST